MKHKDRSLNGIASKNATGTILELKASNLLASSVRSFGDDVGDEDDVASEPKQDLPYPTPCAGRSGIGESTTTLLTARVFSKLGRSDLSRQLLKTLLDAQGSNGFLPRFTYWSGDAAEFIGPFPGPGLFGEAPEEYSPQQAGSQLRGSGTVMAPPHHATAVLETFYLSEQTAADVQFLGECFSRLRRWHDFLHARLATRCPGKVEGAAPCLFVRHPWETEVHSSSPLWSRALEGVTKLVAEEGWSPASGEVPPAVKNAVDYPGDQLYQSFLYLLHCFSDHSHQTTADEPWATKCPFAMADVGFIAALAKSDRDLHQIGQILIDKHHYVQPSWEDMETAEQRSRRSKQMLRNLWDEQLGTFLNRVLDYKRNETGTYLSNYSTPLDLPVASNFVGLWDPLSNATMVERLSFHLLQSTGPFSFLCGDYPLYSIGGCDARPTDGTTAAAVLPLLNYRVSKGLKRNQDVGVGHFIQTSTLNLVCGLPNSDESNLATCDDNLRFATAFDSASHLPLGTDECDLTSTLTAALVLDVLIPDKKFRYDSEPPISNSSVIFLIALELAVAFGIGITCVVLSLNLMRRLKANEEGDAFVRILHEQETNASNLYGEENPSREDVPPVTFSETISDREGFSIRSWSLNLISRVNPLSIWGRRQTHEDDDSNAS